jgi:hypothetical protein
VDHLVNAPSGYGAKGETENYENSNHQGAQRPTRHSDGMIGGSDRNATPISIRYIYIESI